MLVLAVDLGKTSSRVAMVAGGRMVSSARAAGTPGLAHPAGLAAALDVTLRLAGDLTATGDVGDAGAVVAVGVGSAGCRVGAAAAAELAARLRDALGVPRVAVVNDAVTAHVGALGGGAGVVLIAGTGAVALAVDARGSWTLVDGAGWWLGDEGSGAWVGAEGLRAVLRAADGRGPATTLSAAATRRFGSLDGVRALAGELNPAAVAASFGPDVADATMAGDPVAADILRRASAALATTTLAAVGALRTAAVPADAVPVAAVGGLTAWGDPLLGPWRAALGSAVRIVDAPRHAALLGAAELAVRSDLPHERLVHRA